MAAATKCATKRVSRKRADPEVDVDADANDEVDVRRPTAAQERFLASPAKEVLFGGAAGGGKAIPLTTRICTPIGWIRMGDIRVGDQVLDADGNAVKVTATFDVSEPEAWELTFDDGTTQVACADHRWLTLTRSEELAHVRQGEEWRARRKAARRSEQERRAAARASTPGKAGGKGKGKKPWVAVRNASRVYEYKAPPPLRGTTKTTREIVSTLRIGKVQRTNHAIVNPAPLLLPEATLPLDPYVLGAWLGDGDSRGGGLSGLDREVFESVRAAGYRVSDRRVACDHYVHGISAPLRSLGLLKPKTCAPGTPSRKQIPQAYLRGSLDQRLALLQGLCDTDGHATDKGSIEFTTTSRALRDGMVELLATLGVKPSVREGRATLRGRDISAKWRIQFWTELPCFRIQRKLVRQKRDGFRGCHDRRYIVGARRVPSVPMRCISVDSPTSTYLIGDRMVVTHNTAALIMQALERISHKHYRALALRRTHAEMQDNLVERSEELYPAFGGKYNAQKNKWRFQSGAAISYGYLQHKTDRERYKSNEYALIQWDELTTQKSEEDYKYVNSRLRNSHGLEGYIRAASNPGDRGHQWVLRRWGPWLWQPGVSPYPGAKLEDGETIPRPKAGEILWFRSDDHGTEVCTHRRWHNPKCVRCRPQEPCAKHRPQSRTFFPSLVEDNPYLAGTDYESILFDLPPLERARMLYGDWNIMPAAGMYFKRASFAQLEASPTDDVIARVRYWDRASTPGGGDWTAGVLMSLLPGPLFVVEDVVRGQWAPSMVESMIVATAETDPYGTIVALEHDPGQAGNVEVWHYGQELVGKAFQPVRPQGNKLTRARPVASTVNPRQGETHGRIAYVENTLWNAAYFNEMEAFDGTEETPDDQVDATSGAYRVLIDIWSTLKAKGSPRKRSFVVGGRAS